MTEAAADFPFPCPEKPLVKPAYRVVTQALRRRIESGELRLGQALPIEHELAAHFGVHRSTVREALRQLEQDGMVRRDGKRLLVTVPRHSDLARRAERTLRLQQVSLLDVYQVALVMEPQAAALAALAATEAQCQAMADNLELNRALLGTPVSPVEVGMAFQALVAQASHNQVLLLGREPVARLMHAGFEAIAARLPQAGRRQLDAHTQVYEAVRARDAMAAEHAMRRHILDYRRGCEAAGLDMNAPLA